MTIHKNIFEQHGALYIKDVVSKDLCNFLTHCLMRAPYYDQGIHDDFQVKGSAGILDHEIVFDTLQEKLWAAVENVLDEELLPTYTYARLYTNGNELVKHTDRPSCEISMTIQLARSHHYSWPIYMGNQRFDLAEGDGVLYKGCDVEHWRNVCDAPPNYYSGQAFIHFVRKKGPYANYYMDLEVRKHKKMDWNFDSNVYDKNRMLIVENK